MTSTPNHMSRMGSSEPRGYGAVGDARQRKVSAYVEEWAYRGSSIPAPMPIIVPTFRTHFGTGLCHRRHEFGWLCSRLDGHLGRHNAQTSSGEVLAVWR